eukprot:scaffold10197_cov270-Chaetoceros_neogracile.AAC.16
MEAESSVLPSPTAPKLETWIEVVEWDAMQRKILFVESTQGGSGARGVVFWERLVKNDVSAASSLLNTISDDCERTGSVQEVRTRTTVSVIVLVRERVWVLLLRVECLGGAAGIGGMVLIMGDW